MCITVDLYIIGINEMYCVNTLQNPSEIFHIIRFSVSPNAAAELLPYSRKTVTPLANLLVVRIAGRVQQKILFIQLK